MRPSTFRMTSAWRRSTRALYCSAELVRAISRAGRMPAPRGSLGNERLFGRSARAERDRADRKKRSAQSRPSGLRTFDDRRRATFCRSTHVFAEQRNVAMQPDERITPIEALHDVSSARRARRARKSPAEHRQRRAPLRRDGLRAASGRAARLSHRRSRTQTRRPRLLAARSVSRSSITRRFFESHGVAIALVRLNARHETLRRSAVRARRHAGLRKRDARSSDGLTRALRGLGAANPDASRLRAKPQPLDIGGYRYVCAALQRLGFPQLTYSARPHVYFR